MQCNLSRGDILSFLKVLVFPNNSYLLQLALHKIQTFSQNNLELNSIGNLSFLTSS